VLGAIVGSDGFLALRLRDIEVHLRLGMLRPGNIRHIPHAAGFQQIRFFLGLSRAGG
jgi:hypothetical protein